MDWAEKQEYYDLIEEEIKFTPEKGQKWILTLEERHAYGHDIVFHVYSEKGDYKLLVHEVVDVMALDMKTRLHPLGETLSGNLRIHLSTLKADMPADFAHEADEKDESRFKLSFVNRKQIECYEWAFPTGDFKRIKPVLTLIWAVDEWREGAKVMGWSRKKGKPGKALEQGGKENREPSRKENSSKKGRIDPFGSVWNG